MAEPSMVQAIAKNAAIRSTVPTTANALAAKVLTTVIPLASDARLPSGGANDRA